MTEQKPEETTPQDEYFELGKMVGLTGTKPIEALQEQIKKDPQKQESFLKGAAEGQAEKESLEEFENKAG